MLSLLDELILAGMVLETNLESILLAVQDARKLETDENTVLKIQSREKRISVVLRVGRVFRVEL